MDTSKLNKAKVKEPAIIKEFKEFINRGNVVDLAVGVIIGGAFGKIVSSLVADIIMPIIGVLFGGIDFKNLAIDVPNFFGGATAAHIAYGSFLQNVVDFLIIAFCVFMFVKTINHLQSKVKKPKEKEAPADSAEVALLKEIRDALKKK